MLYYKASSVSVNRNMEKQPTFTPQWLGDSACAHWTSRCCRVSVFRLAYFHCDNDVDNLTGVYGELSLSPQVKSLLSPLSGKDCITAVVLVVIVWVQIARNITTNELWNTKRFSYLRGPDGRFYNPYNHGWRRNCSDFLVNGYTRDDEVVPSSILWSLNYIFSTHYYRRTHLDSVYCVYGSLILVWYTHLEFLLLIIFGAMKLPLCSLFQFHHNAT